MSTPSDLPLAGHLVLDTSRMLPGAVLVRMLVDLGARVIKVEDPRAGDPMRQSPPVVDGIGAGFRAYFRGVESIGLDLRTPDGAAALGQLAARADILIESFRPGTLEKWGLGPERLMAANPGLIVCSLSGFGAHGPQAGHVAHDLNLVAVSGLLSQLPPGFPKVQLADVTTGMLACSSILAALLARGRSGRGRFIDQPLALGPLPFLTWGWADASAQAGPGLLETVLSGESPCYRRYVCGDGREVVLGAIEPKFWAMLTRALGLEAYGGDAFSMGDRGEEVASALGARFAEQGAAHWTALAAEAGIPLTIVNTLAEGMAEPYYAARAETLPTPSGGSLQAPGPFMAGWPGGEGAPPAPRVGEQTRAVLAEFGIEPAPGAGVPT
jgi:crotonobetainyl-CoA:carnitine CoA-transferase CaiB-like acyl-CoA transferase